MSKKKKKEEISELRFLDGITITEAETDVDKIGRAHV